MKEDKKSKFFGISMTKPVSSPREAPEYIRNDKEYVGFWAGGRGGDGNLQFPFISLIFMKFEENNMNLRSLHKKLILQLFRSRAPEHA